VTLSRRRLHQQLEACTSALDAAALRRILHGLAEGWHPAERAGFLDRVRSLATPADTAATAPDELLRQIDALREEARDAQDSDPAEYPPPDWDEEDALGPFEDLIPQAEHLLDMAAERLAEGDAATAAAAYDALLELFELEDDYGRGIGPEDFQPAQVREHAALHARAAYLAASPHERSPRLLDAARHWARHGIAPSLAEIAEAGRAAPAGWPACLDELAAALRTEHDPLADAWLREAIAERQGLPGMVALARASGAERPLAWLDWVRLAVRAGEDAAAVAACLEAFGVLGPHAGSVTAQLADSAAPAARRLGDTAALRRMRREAALARPSPGRLAALREACPEPAVRRAELWEVGRALETERNGKLAALAYVLAGDWQRAWSMAEDANALGWSSPDNPQGLMVACVVAGVLGEDVAAAGSVGNQLWRQALPLEPPSLPLPPWRGGTAAGDGADREWGPERLADLVAASFRELALANGEVVAWVQGCRRMAAERARAIVSRKHRGAYDRAALALAACRRAAEQAGDAERAAACLESLRREFPRHVAFQRALQDALGRKP